MFGRLIGILFGLAFAVGGIFFALQMPAPVVSDWFETRAWQSHNAEILSVTARDNETLASYRYLWNDKEYIGDRVYLAQFKDNIGSYHKNLQRELQQAVNNKKLITIYVNPASPDKSIIDRNMRWGLLIFMSLFCGIFILIGLVVAYACFSPDKKSIDEPKPAWQTRKGWEKNGIRSDAASGSKGLWFFAGIWNVISWVIVSPIIDEFQKENYIALVGLMFPLIGLALLYQAIKMTMEFRRFGIIELMMDPYPGSIGGHVGGSLPINLAYNPDNIFTVSLECVHSYVSGSGDNRSRHENIKWAEQGTAKIVHKIEGINLEFRFSVPEHLPESSTAQTGDYYMWRLRVSADLPGVDLNRSYNIPVLATSELSHQIQHDLSAQVEEQREQESQEDKIAISIGEFDQTALSRSMIINDQRDSFSIYQPMGRNKGLTLISALFGGGFSFATWSMWTGMGGKGFFGILTALFSVPFAVVGLFGSLACIYLLLNNLSLSIDRHGLHVVRRLFIVPVLVNKLSSAEISELRIKSTGSTGSGLNKTTHHKIVALCQNGKKVTLAENIDGKDLAEHFKEFLKNRIH